MTNWVNMMDRMKRVRQAQEEFLLREFVDRSIIGPMLLDRLAADLYSGGGYGPRSGMPTVTSMQPVPPIADDRYLE
jgi:hypothetical protein